MKLVFCVAVLVGFGLSIWIIKKINDVFDNIQDDIEDRW